MAGKYDPASIAMFGGAAFGAYIGNIDDDPLGGLLAAGIGAGTGAFLKLSIPDLKAASRITNNVVIPDKEQILAKSNSGFSSTTVRVLGRQSKLLDRPKRQILNAQEQLKKYEEALTLTPDDGKLQNLVRGARKRLVANEDKLQRRLDLIADEARTAGINLTPTMESVETFLNNNKNEKIANRLATVVKTGRNSLGTASLPEGMMRDMPKFTFSPNPAGKQGLIEHLVTKLNNTREEATQKADLLLARTRNDITIKGHTLSIVDENGKRVDLPLTARGEGKHSNFLYHQTKKGSSYAVSGVNPYASAYLSGTAVPIIGEDTLRVPLVDDVLKAHHPEIMYLSNPNLDLKSVSQNVKTSMQFANREFDGIFTYFDEALPEKIKQVGTSINVKHTYNIKDGVVDSENPFRELRLTSNGPGAKPEAKAFYTKLGEDIAKQFNDPVNIFFGQSLNSQGLISNVTDGIPHTLANPMALNERGVSGLGRDTKIQPNKVTDEKKLLSELFGERFSRAFDSANVVSKIDVRDADSFNKLAASLFGSQNILGDGSGLYNPDHADSFRHFQQGSLTIPAVNGQLLLGRDAIINKAGQYSLGKTKKVKTKKTIPGVGLTPEEQIEADNLTTRLIEKSEKHVQEKNEILKRGFKDLGEKLRDPLYKKRKDLYDYIANEAGEEVKNKLIADTKKSTHFQERIKNEIATNRKRLEGVGQELQASRGRSAKLSGFRTGEAARLQNLDAEILANPDREAKRQQLIDSKQSHIDKIRENGESARSKSTLKRAEADLAALKDNSIISEEERRLYIKQEEKKVAREQARLGKKKEQLTRKIDSLSNNPQPTQFDLLKEAESQSAQSNISYTKEQIKQQTRDLEQTYQKEIKELQDRRYALLEKTKASTVEEVSEQLVQKRDIVTPRDTLGYDSKGNAIGLHNRWTSAVINNSRTDDMGNLILDLMQISDPGREKAIKVFSESSKSLLHEASKYNLLEEIALGLNTGAIGKDLQFTDTKQAVTPELLMQRYLGNNLKSDGDLEEQFNALKKKSGTTAFILEADPFQSSMGETTPEAIRGGLSKVFSEDLIKDITTLAGDDLNKNKAAGLLHLMTSGNKYGTDLAHTVAIDLANTIGVEKTRELLTPLSTTEGFTDNALRQRFVDIAAANLDFDKYAQGRSYATVSVNKGMAEVGAGNKARLSWTAFSNLLKSGIDKKTLEHFGQVDSDMLLELKGFISESDNVYSRALPVVGDNVLEGKETDFARIISSKDPEARKQALKDIGIKVDPNSEFISYRLKNSDKMFQLNFATVSTNLSGKYETDNAIIFKELESKKLSIFTTDLETERETNSVVRKQKQAHLNELIEEYSELRQQVLTGNSSLVKKVSSLYSDRSMISVASVIGGEAHELVAAGKNIDHKVFVSEAGMNERLKRAGYSKNEIELEPIEGTKNLKRIMVKGEDGKLFPMSALITREPAQGPLSSTFAELILDETLTTDHRFLHVTENSLANTAGKILDKDQDIIQELYPKFKNEANYQQTKSKFEVIDKALEETISLSDTMKVKGKNKQYTSLLDLAKQFEGITDPSKRMAAINSELTEYYIQAALKGRERKALSPLATELATKMSEALIRQFGKTSEDSLQGRFGLHYIVENLLKSAHTDTREFGQQTESLTEELSRLRQSYVKNQDPTGKVYKQGMERILPIFLNLEGAKAENAENGAKLQKMINNMIEAELANAKDIDQIVLTPLDVNRATKARGYDAALMELISNSGFFDTETTSWHNSPTTSAEQTARAFTRSVKQNIAANKGVLAVGGLALATAALLTRAPPEMDRPRMQHSSKMVRNPQSTPVGMNTNIQNRGYITPNSYNDNNYNISVEGAMETLSADTSVSGINQMQYDTINSIFGDSLRSVKIEI